MRGLLDECLPRKLKDGLVPHDCGCVPELGWAGVKNGELLVLADSAGFDAFLTIDRGIEYQQNLIARRIAVVLISAKSNRLVDLQLHIPEILQALHSLRPGQLTKVGSGTNL